MNQKFPFVFFLIFIFHLIGCSKDDNTSSSQMFGRNSSGSGVFVYNFETLNFSKPLKVFYYLPPQITNQSSVLFVIHGVNRNAVDYRNYLVQKAKEKNIILIVPEFSEEHFPGSHQFNYGYVYANGDLPNPDGLQDESDWTFSVIEPLFAYTKSNLELSTAQYNIIGHSAGAQFLHRLMMFKNNLKINKAVISAAGWYTLPENNTNFPYGLQNCILANKNFENFYKTQVVIQVGSLDNNPNATNLRRNSTVDVQGTHRLARAEYFYDFCQQRAQSLSQAFHWTMVIRPQATHEASSAILDAFEMLY